MSGFFLCWHRDGGTLDDATVARVAARIAHRGPQGLVRRDAPGVTALHARFDVAAGAEDDLPVRLGDWIVTGDIRLDARDALRARLRDHDPVPADATDGLLLAHALRRWGRQATARIIGDYAFAAVDLAAGRLVAARGTLGVKGLFVTEDPRFVACSNDLDALLALPAVDATPDERALRQFLRHGCLRDARRTARRGVRRVESSSQVVWARRGPARHERHWTFPVPSRVRFWREGEYEQQFHEVLEDAIADRLRAPRAGIMLSGGLDSAAIAADARVVVRDVELRALTVSSERVVPDAEAAWARAVAAHLGIAHEVVQTEVGAPLEHLDDPALRTPEPVGEPELAAWRRRARTLAGYGPVAVSGEDGDALLAPPDLWTMLRSLPWRETFAAWRDHRRETGRHPWLGLREVPWRRHRHPLRPRAVAALSSTLWEQFFAEHDAGVTGVPTTFVLPLLDARVIGFVFSIPPIPWAQRKALLRRAFRGRLPDDVLSRPKTPVAGYHEAAIARWRAAGGAERPTAVPMDGLVDVAAWRRTLRESPDVDRVMAGWRVFEVARWLAQPAPPDA